MASLASRMEALEKENATLKKDLIESMDEATQSSAPEGDAPVSDDAPIAEDVPAAADDPVTDAPDTRT